MQKHFSNSVRVISANKEEIAQAVKSHVTFLCQNYPEIVKIIWFGSWVNGIPTPGSDVDLCIVVTDSTKPRHERGIDYLPVGFPVGLDIHVYTVSEFESLPQTMPTWYKAIISGQNIC
ncbi:MAG: nucleotidyltransferase domain-containing protein [Anaerolineales bacterium]|nr:nucleotidyltransferase domain-containing protein [Anaerolineales bacterium]